MLFRIGYTWDMSVFICSLVLNKEVPSPQHLITGTPQGVQLEQYTKVLDLLHPTSIVELHQPPVKAYNTATLNASQTPCEKILQCLCIGIVAQDQGWLCVRVVDVAFDLVIELD